MKRRKIVTIAFLLSGIVLFNRSSSVVHAEEELESVSEQIVEVEENHQDISPKTKTASWFEENLGWVLGVPAGTWIGIIITIISDARRAKKQKAERDKEKENGQKEIDKIWDKIDSLYETVSTVKTIADTLIESQGNSVKSQEEASAKIQELTNLLGNELSHVQELTGEVEKLQKQFGIVVNQNVDYVKNGVSERVNSIIEEYEHYGKE